MSEPFNSSMPFYSLHLMLCLGGYGTLSPLVMESIRTIVYGLGTVSAMMLITIMTDTHKASGDDG